MPITNPAAKSHNRRIKAYRVRLQNQGVKRVEVRIPAQDAPLVHSIANMLRAGGDDARTLREQITHATGDDKHTTGKNLIDFFRSSPLNGIEIDLERDKTTSRTIAL